MMSWKIAVPKVLMVCTGLVLACSLRADVTLYNSTGQATSGSDPIQSFGPLYDSFSTGVNAGVLSKVQLLLSGDNISPGSIAVGLYGDNSTTPGSLITDLGTVSDSSLTAAVSLFDVALGANPTLSAGTRYWLGLSGTTTGNWAWTTDTSGIGVDGEYFSNMTGVHPNNPDGGYQMMDVEVSGVPEPSTISLLAIMLASIATFCRGSIKRLT